MNRLNIGELSERARRTFRNLLHTIEWGNSPLDEEEEMDDGEYTVIIRPLLGEEAERIINCGRTFSELQRALRISSRTLAKYLKICEKNGLVAGYRCGKSVKYYLTEEGRYFLFNLENYEDEGLSFHLGYLAILALSHPRLKFARGPPAVLIASWGMIPLKVSSQFDLENMPEGRIYTLFLRLIRGLGYEVFTRKELETMGIEILWRLSTPIIRQSDLMKMDMLKRIRGVKEKPIHRIMPLIEWATLMSDNIDKYYRLIRNRGYIQIEHKPNKLIIFILDSRGNITHVIA